MKKIFTIANREFRAIVGTKAFLISLSIMPILMFGGIIAMQLLQERGSIEEKKLVVIDHSKQLYDFLQSSAEANNAFVDGQAQKAEEEAKAAVDANANPTADSKEAKDKAESTKPTSSPRRGPPTSSKGTRFVLQSINPDEANEAKMLELSDQVRSQKITGILEIPADVTSSGAVKLYSEDSGISTMNFWLTDRINDRVKKLRFESMGLDPVQVQQATQPVALRNLGLVQVKSDGTVQAAEEKDSMAGILLPLFVMMLMFMVIFMASQPMLESVLEEKSLRIAEVLLGSVNPWQLMWGKLLGCVAGSLTIVAFYVVGAYIFAVQKGYSDMIPMHLIPWFIVFQILGVMFYASIFLAVGASVSQLKEAQSMLLPAWILLMSPMFVWFLLVQEPNGSLAVGFSLFPPATPTTMVLRMATGSTVPTWQLLLGVVLLVAATSGCVWLAGRIFRVGILWQGKTPKLTELVRWAFTA